AYAASLFAGILDRTVSSARATTAVPAPHEPRLQIQLIYFAGCQNTLRAHAALESEGISTKVELIAVETQEEAEQWEFYGSPTIRINGKDVSPVPSGATPSMSCRMYPQPDGRVTHYPSAKIIAAALQHAQAQINEQ